MDSFLAATLRTHPESLKQRFLEPLQDVTDGALYSFLLVEYVGQFRATIFGSGTPVMLSSSGTTRSQFGLQNSHPDRNATVRRAWPVPPLIPASALEKFALLASQGVLGGRGVPK
jgi:hypothetical protein